MGTTNNNYAAHFDMLGFGDAVLRDFDNAWRALSSLRRAIEKAECVVPIPIATGIPLVDKVRYKFFSDSVILYTARDSPDDLLAMFVAAVTLFKTALAWCVPLRGGIAHGRFQMSVEEKNRLFMGVSLVNACRIGEDAQWLGVVVEDEIAQRSPEAVRMRYVIPWVVSGKDGTDRRRWVLRSRVRIT